MYTYIKMLGFTAKCGIRSRIFVSREELANSARSFVRSFVVPEISICRVKYKHALALFWRLPSEGGAMEGGPPQCSMHLVARLDIFATRKPNIVARLPAIYSTRDRAIRPAGRPPRRRARLTFVQLLSQLEGLLIRRAAVVNFVEVQRRVDERLLLEGTGTSLHQNRRRTAGGVELRAQREAEHCNVRQTFEAIP